MAQVEKLGLARRRQQAFPATTLWRAAFKIASIFVFRRTGYCSATGGRPTHLQCEMVLQRVLYNLHERRQRVGHAVLRTDAADHPPPHQRGLETTGRGVVPDVVKLEITVKWNWTNAVSQLLGYQLLDAHLQPRPSDLPWYLVITLLGNRALVTPVVVVESNVQQ
jgi:hypothetical protein